MAIPTRKLYVLRLVGALLLAVGTIAVRQRTRVHTAVDVLPEYSHGVVEMQLTEPFLAFGTVVASRVSPELEAAQCLQHTREL